MDLLVHDQHVYAYTGGQGWAPEKPTVVLIHGALHDHSVWALQSRWLAHQGFSVLALDLPGHGRSTGPALPDVAAHADWLLAVMTAAQVRQATLVGHSMGSLIALEAAARSSTSGPHGCVQGLVLVGTAYPMKVSAALLETSQTQVQKAIAMVNVFSHSTWAPKPSAPSPGFSVQGGNRALMQRIQARYDLSGHGNLFHHDFLVCDRYVGGLDAAAQVHCPSMVIAGNRDQMTPLKAGQPLVQALKAQCITLAAGHNLMAEDPDGVRLGIYQACRAGMSPG